MLRNLSGSKTERLRKNVVKVFKNYGLSITSKTNLKIVDYLDVTFDLQNNSYKPYKKPADLPVCIHKHSNYPPTILNVLPKSITKRISHLSSSKNVFQGAIPVYKEVLRKSGFTSDLLHTSEQFDHNNNNEENKNKKRRIIWFNPPFLKSAKSNIGKTFLNLIKRYFPKTNKTKATLK